MSQIETRVSAEAALNDIVKKDFRIAIVGGGMIGLAAAVSLARAGIEVEVFEATAEYGSIGGIVGLGPNALRALSTLGLLDTVQARAEQPKPAGRRFMFISGTGDHEVIYDCPIGDEDGGLSIQRSAFIECLASLATHEASENKNLTLHLNKRCASVRDAPSSDGQQVELSFTDGTSHKADVVLGIDGVRSVSRSYVLGVAAAAPPPAGGAQGGPPRGPGEAPGRGGGPPPAGLAGAAFMNSVAYRSAIPYTALEKEGIKTDMRGRPHCWIGPEQHIVTFPLKDGEMIHAVVFLNDRTKPIAARPPPPSSINLASSFESWGPDVRTLVSCMDQNASGWPLFGVWPPLSTYVKGNVALLGDAAHGMLPHIGAGIGQGLEDVVVLLGLLRHPKTTKANIKTVLSVYDTHRRPHANAVLEASARAADIFQLHGPSGTSVEGMKTDISQMFDTVWRHDIKTDCEQAIAVLENTQ